MSEPTSLTRAEALERSRLLRVDSYAIDLNLTTGVDHFRSTCSVRFMCNEVGAATFIEVGATTVQRAELNGVELPPDTFDGGRIALANLQADNELVVVADMPYVSTGDGMHRYLDPVDDETYVGAYLGVDHAQRVFANFDQPDLKATLELSVTAPPEWRVVSNSQPDRVDENLGRWEFAPTPVMPTYLLVMVAGPLHSVVTEHNGRRFGLHARRSLSEFLDAEAPEIFEVTTACFDYYAALFDEPYPWGSYDQTFVPELNWGALESAGCVIFTDDFVFRSAVTDTEREGRANVIAHEMAHMWFGDLVTMRWWDDLWLSEAFAEYMGAEVASTATRFTNAWTAFAMTRESWGYDSDQRPSTHPVAPDPADVTDTAAALANFDGISYAKGAASLRQLAAWVGESAFRAGLNDFITRHRFGVAELADLLDSLSRSSGLDVPEWAQHWLRTTGVDTLRVERDADGTRLVHEGTRPHRLAIGAYGAGVGRQRVEQLGEILVGVEADDLVVPVELTPAAVTSADLLLPNDRDLTFAKVRLDAVSLEALTQRLGALPSSLSRAVAWSAMRDLVRDGECDPMLYVDLVAQHIPTETESAIVQGAFDFARRYVANRYLSPERRVVAYTTLASTARALLSRTMSLAGSDLRLIAVRELVATSSLADASEIESWLVEGEVPGGQPLDSDLRWRALLRLSALGRVDEDRIDDEAQRDASGNGPQGAARCHAARPTLGAKQRAWELVFGPGEESHLPSQSLVRASAEGLWQPEQRDLLKPFVIRYFPAAIEVSARRGAAIAVAVGHWGFPVHDTDESTLAAGLLALEDPDITTTLKRRLGDHLDDLRRALRVRALDAA